MILKLLNIAENLSYTTIMSHWRKKDSRSCFDVTMESFNGTEICELTGIYLLSKLVLIVPKEDAGLY